ncbi:Arc-like DNA binding dprotein [Pseudomonas sp. SJZ085]|uniref:CopG family ribbon-helix-helix protein n=1 Tax=unclassified Pseudomonas TaxID=196821 RepID=UPI00119AFAFC|nr:MULTISPECIES: Arc family DNA-binding protein [unclassified Pseudomonas]TWC18159.1 Arc-like DNA binding dprotein [Pseudomonas sp. SJZ074]TWC36131.1 Arc-like DNA binding dprotein [Pseudomonas sp. SJZ085]
MNKQFDSRLADKFVVRLPDGMRDEIDARATADDRSMNSVFVQAMRQYLDNQQRQELLLGALAAAAVKKVDQP